MTQPIKSGNTNYITTTSECGLKFNIQSGFSKLALLAGELAQSTEISKISQGYSTTISGNNNIFVWGSHNYLTSPIQINNPTTSTDTLPKSIYVKGDYAYIVNNTSNTLQIFNVTLPTTPVLVSTTPTTGTNPNSIYVQGNHVYIVYGSNYLQIIDVSNPSSPALVGDIGTDNNPVSVFVKNNYAYIVNNTSDTLQIFDISNPALCHCVRICFMKSPA